MTCYLFKETLNQWFSFTKDSNSLKEILIINIMINYKIFKFILYEIHLQKKKGIDQWIEKKANTNRKFPINRITKKKILWVQILCKHIIRFILFCLFNLNIDYSYTIFFSFSCIK
jgi:hypothetical protein